MAVKSNIAEVDDRTLVITRVFDAPISLLWQAFTRQEYLDKWSAPHGFSIPSSGGDLRPGGKWHCVMHTPDGNKLSLGGVYREIVENKLLVMTHAWNDETGEPGPETVVTIRFEDLGGKTRVTLQQTGFDSVQSRDGHTGGWGECLDILSELLTKLRG
jgi:uncharacterized protein YndB with AHSA1/START domain